MAVVPMVRGQAQAPAQAQQQPSETALLMALAEMHKQGRFDQAQNQSTQYEENWNALSESQQKTMLKNSYTPKDDGEYNKYDDTFAQHGSVVLPSKKIFGQDEWQWSGKDATGHDMSKSWKGVDRYDLPDGRVILRKQALTS